MKKQILEYMEYIEAEIDSIKSETISKSSFDEKRISDLIAFNNQRITDFQHERLVHMFIMLFFGILCIVSFLSFFFSVHSSNVIDNGMLITGALIALTLILFIVEIFYLKHYFFLENSVQKIYAYEKILFEILRDNSNR